MVGYGAEAYSNGWIRSRSLFKWLDTVALCPQFIGQPMLIPHKRQERELKSLVSTIHQQLETSRMVRKHRIHQQRSTPKAEKQRLSIFAHLVFENILYMQIWIFEVIPID